MKFLQSGDSVVSLRFKFKGLEMGSNAEDVAYKVEIDTATDVRNALMDLFPRGAEVPAELLDQAQRMVDVATDAQISITDDWVKREVGDLGDDIKTALDAEDHTANVDGFTAGLTEFLSSFTSAEEMTASAELKKLSTSAEHTRERVEAGADTREAFAELVDDVTKEGITNDAERTREGKQTPDKAVLAVSGKVADVPAQLAKFETALADVSDNTNLGSPGSIMASMQYMEAMANMEV